MADLKTVLEDLMVRLYKLNNLDACEVVFTIYIGYFPLHAPPPQDPHLHIVH